MTKYELSTSCRYISKQVVQLVGSAKMAHPRTPLRASAKLLFINAIWLYIRPAGRSGLCSSVQCPIIHAIYRL